MKSYKYEAFLLTMLLEPKSWEQVKRQTITTYVNTIFRQSLTQQNSFKRFHEIDPQVYTTRI